MGDEQKATVADPGPIITAEAPPGPSAANDGFEPIDTSRYLLGEELGRGGMGRILLAQDRRLARPVAIKQLLTPGGKAQRRFEREVRITARLQHPAIVPVYEGGRWPTGEPFYVMKRVSGRTLEEAIEATRSLKERLGLLANVIAVSDALAYAHEQGIVHRDLKPQNVLVGEFGETVIIDWGLAKDLAAVEAPEDDELAGPYRTRAHELTVTGRALGTPAYMPPEQARGEPADQRSDVYALGALLHHVLSGEPPYQDGPSDSVLEKVLAGPPPPLGARAPGVPPDLAAIVAKMMAREPEDRYPNAAAVSADLKRFQTGQLVGAHSYSLGTLLSRWVRKHRAAVAVALVLGVALAATLVVSIRRVVTERDHAALERGRAEGERQAAESLVQFMLVDLRDKLLPIGKLELMEGVGDRVDGYYQRLATSVGRLDRARRGQRALALGILGDVRRARGDLPAALGAYEGARQLHQQLAEEAPAELAWQRGLAEDHLRLGELDSDRGDEEAALAAYRAGLAASERIARLTPPDDAASLRGLHVAHLRVGDALRYRGDVAGALTEYRAAATLAERFTGATELALALTRVGDMEVESGDLAGAIRDYGAALAASEKLVAAAPDDAQRQRDLLVANIKVGDSQVSQQDYVNAAPHYAAARAIAHGLVERDPANLPWLRSLYVVHIKEGDAAFEQGHHQAAAASFEAARTISARLVEQDAANPKYQRDLTVAYERLGDTALARGQQAAARAAYQQNLTLSRAIAEKTPANTQFQTTWIMALIKMGDVDAEADRLQASVASYRQAIDLLTKLVASDVANVEWQHYLAASHGKLGDVLLAQGKLEPALAAARARLAVTERLSQSDPARVEWRAEHGVAAGKVGRVLARGPAGRIEARTHYARALELLRAVDQEGRLTAGQKEIFGQLEREAASLGR